jgi:hypothetical protein
MAGSAGRIRSFSATRVRTHRCPPAGAQLAELERLIGEIVIVANSAVCQVAGHGWLIWTKESLRQPFRQGCEIEGRLGTALPRIKDIFLHTVGVRWGIWIDQ